MSTKRANGMASSKSLRNGTLSTTTNGAAAAVDPLDPSQLDIRVVGWNNLETKFNELRGLLSAPASGLNANEARALQKKRVSAAIVMLLDRAQLDCRRLLIEGNAKAAVEGGLKVLRLKEAYYGHGHLQLVPAYFHLARTNQFMDKFKAAEEFLSLAQWTILRNKDVDVSLKAELHQTFGLLYASDSKLDAALKQLTSATYYLCIMNGPEHILTSFGYFDLGNVFAAKSHMEHAMAFYDKVKDVWYQHLSTSLRRALEPADAANDSAVDGDGSGSSLENAQDFYVAVNFGLENLQDAVKMLRGIVGLQTERYGRVHPSVSRAEYVLGMFMLWNGDAVSAVSSLLRALEISKRVFGERHPHTGEIRSLMLNFHLEVPDDTSHVLDEPQDDLIPRDAHPNQQTAAAPEQETVPAAVRIPTPPAAPRPPSSDIPAQVVDDNDEVPPPQAEGEAEGEGEVVGEGVASSPPEEEEQPSALADEVAADADAIDSAIEEQAIEGGDTEAATDNENNQGTDE